MSANNSWFVKSVSEFDNNQSQDQQINYITNNYGQQNFYINFSTNNKENNTGETQNPTVSEDTGLIARRLEDGTQSQFAYTGQYTATHHEGNNYDNVQTTSWMQATTSENNEYNLYTQLSHRCDLCEQQFSEKHLLDQHFLIHIKNAKSYPCDVCDKIFGLESVLEQHKLQHNSGKPYSCRFCSMKFTYKSTLNHHIRIHTGEKPYACVVCPKKYNQKYNLTRHMKTHKGE